MKIASLPILVVALGGLLVSGCTSASTKQTLQQSDPDVQLYTDTGASLSATSISEAGGNTSLTLAFSEALVDPIVVKFAISGTATEGTDFTFQTDAVEVPAGATALSGGKYLAVLPNMIQAIDDAVYTGDLIVNVAISEVSYGRIALPFTVQVTITEDEVAPKPTAN